MTERSITRELPSLHYNKALLRDLLELITDSEEADVTMSIRWGNVKHQYNSLEEVYNAKNIPNNIKNFTLTIVEGDNKAVVRAKDSPNQLHEIYLSGSDGWVRKIDDRVSEFAEINKNFFGNLSKYILYIQVGLLGIFFILYQEMFNQIFISFYRTNVELMYHLRAFFVLSLVGILEVVKRTYPFTVLELDESSFAHKRLVRYTSIIATIILVLGSMANIYGIL